MHFNEISGAVVDSAMKVHTALGPGLLESVYTTCLVHELRKRGFQTATQLPLPVNYDGERMDLGFRIDLLVENTVVVEIKAVDAVHPVHLAQVIHLSQTQREVRRPVNQFQRCTSARWYSPHGAR
jgi:GxxExxY protein